MYYKMNLYFALIVTVLLKQSVVLALSHVRSLQLFIYEIQIFNGNGRLIHGVDFSRKDNQRATRKNAYKTIFINICIAPSAISQ